MATNNMNNLTTLIKRLEAATSRLEDIASSAVNFDSSPQQNGVPQAAAAGSASAPPSAPSAPPAPQPPKAAALPPSVEAFDSLINNEVNTWVNLSKKLGGVVAEQASAVTDAFAAERNYLLVATKAKKPEMGSNAYMELLKDLQKALSSADELRQVNRASPFKDHLAMVADGLGALGWIQADSKPADLLMDLFGGAQLYGNKVLKEYKEKDPAQVEWVQAFYKIFKSLQALVKQHYLGGVTWNKDGIDATEALKQVKAGGSSGAPAPPPPGGAGGPPPPPPPPPLPTFDQLPPPPPPKGNAAGDMGAVFEQLNRGEAVTSGLRKVDASQMTHKNPALRASSTVPERKGSTDSIGRSKSPAPPGKKPKPESMRTKKPPKKELDGQKWIIDNFDSPSSIVEIEANLTQSVLISRCKNTTIRINGKANAISVDNSSRLSLILDSLVSSVDVIKCPNFALQILGTVPTILLDQVDGATLYLSKDSLSTEVFTSKCSSVNVTLPPDTEDGDYKECPAPEQIRSYVKDGQLVSEIVEHAG